MIKKHVFAAVMIASALVLPSCTTKVVETNALSSEYSSSINVVQVDVTLPQGATEGLASRIEAEVQEQLALRKGSGTRATNVSVAVSEFKVVTGSARFMVGALAGSNKLTADVLLTDAASGETLGAFKVNRSSNPGGYGILIDQEAELIKSAAKGIAMTVYPTEK